MKSFGIKRDEKDPRWAKFIEWLNVQKNCWNTLSGKVCMWYGIADNNAPCGLDHTDSFTRIITLDEWEVEFMNKLAGSEYDKKLLEEFAEIAPHVTRGHIKCFLNRRYATQNRITEIKEQIEKLSNELKELEK